MAEKSKPLPNAALEHRLNHVHYGNLGRISYTPANDEAQSNGRLQTSRRFAPKSYFKTVSEFAEICPPSRTVVERIDVAPAKALKGQKNWLLKTHPEAIAFGSDVASILPQEISILRSGQDVEGNSIAPLAVGEITDFTGAMQVISRPALAMAAGEGGHILHIVTLDREVEGWSDKGLAVESIKVSKTQRGEWVEDGAPITNIKFAVDGRRFDTIRWIIVQKDTGTTVFEPEIMLLPYQGNRSPREHIQSLPTAPSHISAKRLFTIKTSLTGGRPHVDVSFNPVSDGRSPQLAIIDASGEWSVFDITGSRSARPKNLHPMLTAHGNMAFGSVPKSPTDGLGFMTRKLLWLALEDRSQRSVLDMEEPMEDSYHWGLYSRSPTRSKYVLACNDTDVRLYDSTQSAQLTGLKLVTRAESILDMLVSPFSASQVFVLTTAAIFWLDVKPTKAGVAKITVILSCAHYRNRNVDEKKLRFNVTPIPGSGPAKTCAVFISSPRSKEADLFIFSGPTDEEAARVSHQTIIFDIPGVVNTTLISALPIFHYRPRAKGDRANSAERQSFPANKACVFQLFGLGANLSLGTAQFALSDASLQNLSVPKPLEERQSWEVNLRKKMIHHLRDSFVVPDGYTEQSTAPVRTREVTPRLPERASNDNPTRKYATSDMETAYIRLRGLTTREVATNQSATGGLVALLQQRVAEELGDGDHVRLRTLSELLDGSIAGAANIERLEDDLAEFREAIMDIHKGRAQLVDFGSNRSANDLQSLAESLSALSFATDDASEEYRNNQIQLIRRLATQHYLSRFGVTIPPPQAISLLPISDSQSQSLSQTQTQSQSQSLPRLSQIVEESHLLPSSQSLPSSPPTTYRQSSSRLPSSQPDIMDLDDSTQPDPGGPLTRLQQYVTIPPHILAAPLPGQPTRLLSHWAPGTDPDLYVWRGEDSRAALQEETDARRRKRDEARRRRMEKRLGGMRIVEEQQPTVGVPRIIQSSQLGGIQSSQQFGGIQSSQIWPGGGIMSSQLGGGDSQSQGFGGQKPRISMSQVVPGPFGARPGAGGTGKKKKGKSGFR